jgi:DNA-binding NarL/FixJ family response regulator
MDNGITRRAPTVRQLEIGQLIACGHVNKEIATELGIGIQTVKRHVGELYHRLGVSSRAELVGLLLVRGVVDREHICRELESRAARRIAAGM